MSSAHIMIMTTTDSVDEARSLARGLVEGRLAACVQALPITSHYSWEGALEESEEVLLLIKTAAGRYEAVEEFLNDKHSYDTPEIVQVPVTAGSQAYLAWVDANTAGG